MAALLAFNRDALTNRPRISLLDKASFILIRHVVQRLHLEMQRVEESTFLGGDGGSADGILYLGVLCLIMPEPSAFTHTHSHIHIYTDTYSYPEAGSFLRPLNGDSSAYFSQHSPPLPLPLEKWSIFTDVCPKAIKTFKKVEHY